MTMKRFFSADRLRAFIRTPLWFGLPAAAVAGFAAVWAICTASPAVDNPLKSAAISSVCVAAGWILGIWASAAPDSTEKGSDETDNVENDASVLRTRFTLIALLLLFLAIISIPDILRVVEDGRPAAIGIAGFTTKLLGIAAVIIPVWLRLRNR